MENFLSVKNIFSPGNTLSLNFTNETSYLKTFFGTVVGSKNNNLLLKIWDEWLISRLKPGVEVNIGYQNSAGKKYSLGSYLINQVVTESAALILLKPWRVDFSTLRRYNRKEVNLPFYFFINNETYSGQAVNLSACGLFAYVDPNSQLTIGSQIAFQLRLVTSILPLQLKGEITRIEIADNKLGVALNFLYVTSSTREEILKYLLHLR